MIIAMGSTAEKLSKQIIGLPERFDRMADAVNVLYDQGIISVCQANQFRRKILREIERWERLKK